MNEIKRINPARVLKRLLILCIGFFVLGGIVGYTAGKAAAEAKIEENIIVETASAEIPQQLPPTKPIIEVDPDQPKSLGEFTLSAYCACSKCCGKSDGITATGAKAVQGVTIAVDPDVIPYGTTVIINGKEYIAQDTMASHIISKYDGRIIDIYFNNHSEALKFGIQTANVYVKG